MRDREEVRRAHWEALATIRVGDDPTGEVTSEAGRRSGQNLGVLPEERDEA